MECTQYFDVHVKKWLMQCSDKLGLAVAHPGAAFPILTLPSGNIGTQNSVAHFVVVYDPSE